MEVCLEESPRPPVLTTYIGCEFVDMERARKCKKKVI